MSAALELIRTMEANGGRFRIDGEYLVIAPGQAAAPVMEELRQHKAELMAELARRPAMPAGVRLVSWSPKDAPVRLSRVLDCHGYREIHPHDADAVGCPVERERLAGWGLGIVGPARPSGGLRLHCGP